MKISSPYHIEINTALKENMPALEFGEGEVALPSLALPLRLGEILDYINSITAKTLQLGDFKVDMVKNTISNGSKTLELTEKEIAILKFLAGNEAAASREEMLKNIWGYSDNADSKTVENHIYRLRSKVQEVFAVQIIITEPGGYKLIEN